MNRHTPQAVGVALDSGRAVVRLIPRFRPFATVQAVNGHTPQAVGVALDSGFAVVRLIPRFRPFAMVPAGEPLDAPKR